MKNLLRSLFIADHGDNSQLVLRNYHSFVQAKLGFEVPEYTTLWTYIQDFVQTHNHIPEVSTLRAHFKQAREDEVLDQLERLVALPCLVRGDFITLLEAKANDRRLREWGETLKTAATIAATGLTVREKGKDDLLLKGPQDSARYVVERAHDIVAPTLGGRLSGEVTRDGVAAREEYITREIDPTAGMGQYTFLDQIDRRLGGAKRQELWIHAAFTGGLKSTFMLNWAYNQAVIYKHDSMIFSLEMPYQQCRRILFAMHTLHPKFRELRLSLGLQTDPDQDKGLPYKAIRDAKLADYHPNAKRYYLDYVIPDFGGEKVINHPLFDADYGKIHIQVANPDKQDFTIHDLRMAAETQYAQSPYATLFVDHCGLMAARKQRSNTTDNLNEVLRDLKKLSLGFNRGQGMAVVGLFQISREGYKAALKTKEKTGQPGYNLTHLSYANEAERSADVVTSTWVDEEFRKQNRVYFQNLKARDEDPFDPFVARVEWSARRLFTNYDIPLTPDENASMGSQVDAAAAKLDA